MGNKKLVFNKPGLYTIKATSTDNTQKTAKLLLRVYPVDLMTLELNYASWYSLSDDKLGISFQITNKEYGAWVEAVELYVYATDAWGNNIYKGNTVYYGTTEKDIGPGRTINSDQIVIPNRSRISDIYCGIHKIKLSGEASHAQKTYDPVDYSCWDYK